MVSNFSIWSTDEHDVLVGTLLSIFGITTWVLPYVNFGVNTPSWTISTLCFWYLFFPFVFPTIQKWSNQRISNKIVEYYWIQLGIGILTVVGFGGLSRNFVSQLHPTHNLVSL